MLAAQVSSAPSASRGPAHQDRGRGAPSSSSAPRRCVPASLPVCGASRSSVTHPESAAGATHRDERPHAPTRTETIGALREGRGTCRHQDRGARTSTAPQPANGTRRGRLPKDGVHRPPPPAPSTSDEACLPCHYVLPLVDQQRSKSREWAIGRSGSVRISVGGMFTAMETTEDVEEQRSLCTVGHDSRQLIAIDAEVGRSSIDGGRDLQVLKH
jgi:hypothetical protein